MISYKHEVFIEVARQLSFTKASQTLFISQSAISKQIQALEVYYKTGLFERKGNTVSLTAAGQLLYERLLVARQLQHELHQDMQTISQQFTPPLQMAIGASTTISLYVLPHVLSAYLNQHPALQLTLKNRNSENILKALLDHEIDLGVVEAIRQLSSVTYTPFLTDEVIAVCSPHSPLKNQTLTVSDLYHTPLALREYGSGTLAGVEKALAEHQVDMLDLPVKVRLGGTEALKNFVRVDTCLAFLPRQAVQKELLTGELISITIQDLTIRRTFHFIQRKGTENNRPYHDFIQFTRRHYAKTE